MSAAEISSGRDDIITLNIAAEICLLYRWFYHINIYILIGARVQMSPNTYFGYYQGGLDTKARSNIEILWLKK